MGQKMKRKTVDQRIKSSRQIAYGAMVIALMGMLVLLNRMFSNVISGLLLLIYPLPMLVYSSFYGWKASGSTFIAMTLLVLLTASGIITAITAIGQMLVGMVYGCNAKKNVSPAVNLLIAMLLSGILLVTQIFVSVNIIGYNMSFLINSVSNAIGYFLRWKVISESMRRTSFYIFICLLGVGNGWVISVMAELLLDRLSTMRIRI